MTSLEWELVFGDASAEVRNRAHLSALNSSHYNYYRWENPVERKLLTEVELQEASSLNRLRNNVKGALDVLDETKSTRDKSLTINSPGGGHYFDVSEHKLARTATRAYISALVEVLTKRLNELGVA